MEYLEKIDDEFTQNTQMENFIKHDFYKISLPLLKHISKEFYTNLENLILGFDNEDYEDENWIDGIVESYEKMFKSLNEYKDLILSSYSNFIYSKIAKNYFLYYVNPISFQEALLVHLEEFHSYIKNNVKNYIFTKPILKMNIIDEKNINDKIDFSISLPLRRSIKLKLYNINRELIERNYKYEEEDKNV